MRQSRNTYAAHTRHVGEDKRCPHATASHACMTLARTVWAWPCPRSCLNTSEGRQGSCRLRPRPAGACQHPEHHHLYAVYHRDPRCPYAAALCQSSRGLNSPLVSQLPPSFSTLRSGRRGRLQQCVGRPLFYLSRLAASSTMLRSEYCLMSMLDCTNPRSRVRSTLRCSAPRSGIRFGSRK